MARLLSAWIAPAATAAAYFVSALVGLVVSRGTDGIAAFWPSNGILLSALVLCAPTQRWRHLAWCLPASYFANAWSGSPPGQAMLFTAANLLTGFAAAGMLRHFGGGRDAFETTAGAVRIFVSIGIAVFVGGAIATLGIAASGGDVAGAWLSWVKSDVLGTVLVTALILTTANAFQRRVTTGIYRQALRLAWPILTTIAISSIVFAQSRLPLLFVPLAAVLILTYRTGSLGAVLGTCSVAIIATIAMLSGHGPISLIVGSTADRIDFLQFYIAVMFGTCLPLAALLARHMQLAEERADSERRYKLLADNSNDLIVRLSLQGVRRYVSPASIDLLGYTPEELLGQSAAGSIHPDDRATAIATCNSLLTGQINPMCVYRQLHRNGSYVWLEASYRLIRDDAGEPVELIATVRDVARRERAELERFDTDARLREANRLLLMAEDLGGVGHWRVDVASGLVFWSDVVCAIHGEAPGDAPPLDQAIDAYHPDDRSMVQRHVDIAISDGTPFAFSARIIRRDGVVRHIMSRGRTERGPNGSVVGIFGVIQDVSEAHAADAALQDASRRLRDNNRLLKMAESVGRLGHWRIDYADGRMLWSDEIYRLYGFPRDLDPTIENALNVYHPDDVAAVRATVAHARAHDRGYTSQARIVRPDGAIVHIVTRAEPETGADGKVIGLFGVVQDITDRVRVETALEAAIVEAEGAAKAKSSFLANMSHEIRTPMNGVIGFTELLLASPLADEQRRQAEMIADSGRAMMRLLNDILDLSKVEAGQMIVAEEPFDLVHTLRACVNLITPTLDKKGLRASYEFAPDLPKIVCGDGLRLRQILLNLLGNAAKFTAVGAVTLRASAYDDMVLIEVADTGIGISPSRQASVFDPFVQADGGIAARYGGTGLGLSISRRLTTLMGGTLRVESEPGRGTSFFLLLPLASTIEAPASVPQRVSSIVAPHQQARPRILVAEDHPVNRMLMAAMLDKLGYACDLAIDGGEAIDMVDAAGRAGQPYALVLMDMQMPETDGVQATRRIRASGLDAAALPIVALTANAYADDVATCLDAGMQAHLAKPVALGDLNATLARWAAVSHATVAASHTDERTNALEAFSRRLREDRSDDIEDMRLADGTPASAATRSSATS